MSAPRLLVNVSGCAVRAGDGGAGGAVILVANEDEAVAVQISSLADHLAGIVDAFRDPAFDLVFRQGALEDRGIDIHTGASDIRVVVQNLTDDAHVTGVDGPVQHQRGQ